MSNYTSQDSTDGKPLIEQAPQKPKYELKKLHIGKLEIDLPLIALCLMNFFLNAACSVIAPFYPNIANEAGLSAFEIGIVIGMHPVGGFIFGLVVAKFMVKMGRRNLMWGSLVVTVLTLVLLGVSYYMTDSRGLFFAVGLISRFFMGCARSGYGSTTFAYAPLLWPEKVARVIGIMETFTGLGLMLGPLIGAGIQGAFSSEEWGYQGVFYILSGIFAVFIYPSIIMLPVDEPIDPKTLKKNIPLGKILSQPKQLGLFLLLTGSLLTYSYILPLWENLMVEGYGIEEGLSAVFMTVGTLTYILSLTVIPLLIKKQFNKMVILTFGSFMGIICDLAMGPPGFFGAPKDSYVFTVCGLLLAGIAQGSCILPFIPEMIELVLDQFKDDPELKKQAGDMASGLFMAAYSFGTFLGPFFGGLFYSAYAGPHIQDKIPKASGRCQTFCLKNLQSYPKPEHHSQLEACYYIRPFQITSYYMALIAFVFFLVYLTFGRAYQGFIKQFGKKKEEKQIFVNRKGEEQERAGLSDALMTDSEFENDLRSMGGAAKKQYKDSSISDN